MTSPTFGRHLSFSGWCVSSINIPHRGHESSRNRWRCVYLIMSPFLTLVPERRPSGDFRTWYSKASPMTQRSVADSLCWLGTIDCTWLLVHLPRKPEEGCKVAGGADVLSASISGRWRSGAALKYVLSAFLRGNFAACVKAWHVCSLLENRGWEWHNDCITGDVVKCKIYRSPLAQQQTSSPTAVATVIFLFLCLFGVRRAALFSQQLKITYFW